MVLTPEFLALCRWCTSSRHQYFLPEPHEIVYLSGFALTLMFVIARIVELMQQMVNAEEETDALKQRLNDIAASKTRVLPNGESKSKDSPPSILRKRATAASDPKND